MKTTITIIALAATLASGPTRSNAQGNAQVRPQSQGVAIPTSYLIRSSDDKTSVMSFEQMKAITQSSIREAVSNQLKNITSEEVNARLSGSFDALAGGKAVSFASQVSGLAAHSITEQ